MRTSLIELDDVRAAEIVICANSEILADGRELDGWEEEAIGAAVRAAQIVIRHAMDEHTADEDSFFANWRGGKHVRADLRAGCLVANLYTRERDDESGDFGPWSWAGPDRSGWTPAQVEQLEALINAADEELTAELEVQEVAIATRNAE